MLDINKKLDPAQAFFFHVHVQTMSFGMCQKAIIIIVFWKISGRKAGNAMPKETEGAATLWSCEKKYVCDIKNILRLSTYTKFFVHLTAERQQS